MGFKYFSWEADPKQPIQIWLGWVTDYVKPNPNPTQTDPRTLLENWRDDYRFDAFTFQQPVKRAGKGQGRLWSSNFYDGKEVSD